jgi:hypothetical protein
MMDHDIVFAELTPEGVTKEHRIKHSAVMACPHLILVPEHYNEDQSCRCRDSSHHEMAEWGYTWSEREHLWL